MIKVLFVCHGNICRSPMAEFIFKDLVSNKGIDDLFEIDSKATSREELGSDMYPPAKSKLREYGVPFERRLARQISMNDYYYYDYIVGMDQENLYNMKYMFDGDKENKVSLLLDYTKHPRAISDPWYSGDFETTYQDIVEGCEALLKRIIEDYRQ